ncbi:MAG: polysaccharide biosynthesis protein, partial [Rhodobacteraceae bacterium]
LALLLPVTGIGILIAGFNPTRVETAHRHLIFGRVSTIQIATQAVGVIAAIAFAYYTKSVWAFVFSNIISGLAQLWMFNKFLPGHKNSFRWERPAAEELIKFGKWIFLSTLCSFLFQQGDKMILGKFLSIENLGVYNIGFFLASFPIMMSSNIVYKVLVPLYREKPPSASRENYQKLRKMRILFTSGVLGMLMIFAFLGVILVQFMYDDRYQAAGAIVVMIAVMQIPNVIVLTYSQSALATGDSRRYFVLSAAKAFFMVTALIIGAQYYGLIGALVAQGAATLLIYPVAVWLARQQGAWDPWHDIFFALIGATIAALALWMNMDAIVELAKIGTS